MSLLFGFLACNSNFFNIQTDFPIGSCLAYINAEVNSINLCRYEEYRSEYISTQKRAYFEAHKEEKW